MIDNENTNTPLIDGDFANDKLTINGNLNVTGSIHSDLLCDTGNAYACINSTGALYRSLVACV